MPSGLGRYAGWELHGVPGAKVRRVLVARRLRKVLAGLRLARSSGAKRLQSTDSVVRPLRRALRQVRLSAALSGDF